MKLNVGWTYRLAALVAWCCFVVLVALQLQTPARLRHGVAQVDHTRNVQAQIQRIRLTLLELESSQRGYLLTHERPYLEPHRSGLTELDAQLAALSTLSAQRPTAAADLARLQSLVIAKRAELAQTLSLADSQGTEAALVVVRSGYGKALMDDIRSVLERMDAEESNALEQYRLAQANSLQGYDWIAAGMVALISLLTLALYILIRRDQALRKNAAQVEAAHQRTLEQRVQERTLSLAQASHALELSEARLRGIFESATVAILTVNEGQVIESANASAAAMLGCEIEDLIQAPLSRFIPERFRPAHKRDVKAFGESEIHARHMGRERDVMGLRADGREFPLDAAISHIRVGDERLYTVIMRDISSRRRAEQALLASKAKLDAALESMNDAVFIADADARLVEMNEAFASFHRFENKSECRQTLAEYPELIDVFMANGAAAPLEQWALSRALQGETGTGVEYQLRRKDTGESWFGSYSFAPIRAKDGAIVGAVVTARDMTELKQARVELETSHADLQRLMAAQDRVQENERKRIARELHDDLQQTLAAIRMDAVALGQCLPDASPEVAAMLQRIDKVAESAITSTRRIVNDLRPQLLEDLGLLAALEVLTENFSEHTGIACTLEAQEGVGESLGTAPMTATCFFRVAQEALNNVTKHAQATAVALSITSASDGTVVLSICDNGRGIAAGQQRGPQSFGLLGMHERVRALGGSLRIESTLHAGTTVEVALNAQDVTIQPEV